MATKQQQGKPQEGGSPPPEPTPPGNPPRPTVPYDPVNRDAPKVRRSALDDPDHPLHHLRDA